MKIFAHRGWSAGENENTILVFEKSVKSGIDGVEFDIRFDYDIKSVIVTHNKTENKNTVALEEALCFLQKTNLELLIEFKEYSDALYAQTVQLLLKYNLNGRTTIFAFPKVAIQFPWSNRKDVKLGIIAPFPQDIKKYAKEYNPDMILFGWGSKRERLLFKVFWSIWSLKKTFLKYPSIKFVIGVAYTEKDKKWLANKNGLYGITIDMPN